jgi:hypothetical protein
MNLVRARCDTLQLEGHFTPPSWPCASARIRASAWTLLPIGARLRISCVTAPILFCLAAHRRRIWVLHLEPIGRATGAVGRPLTLGDDAFQPDGARGDTLAVPTVPPIAASGSRDLARPRPVPKQSAGWSSLMVYGRPGDPNGKALDFVEAAEIAGMKRDVAGLDRGEVRALLRLLGSVDTGNDFSTGAFCEMASNGVGDCDE